MSLNLGVGKNISVIISLVVTCYLLLVPCPPESSRIDLSLVPAAYSEVLERIVAIVNDEVVLLSEYREVFEAARKTDASVEGDRVLDEMINRILILEQARRLRLGSSGDVADDDALVKEYIDRRIRPLVHIPIEEIEDYYIKNIERSGNKEFYDVKDEIENILSEGYLQRKLAGHIQELRKKAFIRVQLNNAE
ncbi:MAG: hypothetical protein C4560_02025 [Nitrospiraceae bacterium]|nr:MAG: hypothetical protein C4560_02025 [Nitrospiraceae bacterium]